MGLSLVLAQDAPRFPHTATVHAWPLSSPSPVPYLEIAYDATSRQTTLSKTHPVSVEVVDRATTDPLIRVGLWEPDARGWKGVVTTASAFQDTWTQTISLHLDDQGEVWHVGFYALPTSTASPRPPASKRQAAGEMEDRIRVELVRAVPGPTPPVNAPVVLDEHGKTPEKEVEKTFFQKYVSGILPGASFPQADHPAFSRYWWALLALALFALVGSGEK
ncbi:MAG: hypothetical protein M1826_006776 [Phylliscum demangeonii]|nr:MAG: hypothetical protein M1826_006776 [Phylliscum demangeonii]